MKILQLSVFEENKPGHLSAPCRLLAEHGIDIRALTLADTQRYGILRLLVKEPDKARAVLESAGQVVKTTEVLAVEVADQPGGLAKVLAALEGSPLNIEYVYAAPFGRSGKAALIFRFDDPDKAAQHLQGAGINVLSASELFGS
jgi:hypothetical protein